MQFSESLENSLTTLKKPKLAYYISGDTNINLLQNETNNNIKNSSDMLFILGCLPLVNFPMCISNTSTLIDHIYTNNILHKNTTYILINDLSDDLPILTLLYSFENTAKNKCTTIGLRNMFIEFLYFLLFYHNFYYLAKCIYSFDTALSTVKNCADCLFLVFSDFTICEAYIYRVHHIYGNAHFIKVLKKN